MESDVAELEEDVRNEIRRSHAKRKCRIMWNPDMLMSWRTYLDVITIVEGEIKYVKIYVWNEGMYQVMIYVVKKLMESVTETHWMQYINGKVSFKHEEKRSDLLWNHERNLQSSEIIATECMNYVLFSIWSSSYGTRPRKGYRSNCMEWLISIFNDPDYKLIIRIHVTYDSRIIWHQILKSFIET